MSQRMKWLDDERYIRVAGALLFVSPFFNFILSVANNSQILNKWDPVQLWSLFMAASTLQWILRFSKVVVGYLMFRGKSSAWVPVLAILGVTIFLNFYTFKKDIQVSQLQAVTGILINVTLFLIVFRAEFRINQEVEQKLKLLRQAKIAAANKAAAQPAPVDTPTFSIAKPAAATTSAPSPRFTSPKTIAPEAVPPNSRPSSATTASSLRLVKPANRKKKTIRYKDFLIARGTSVEFEGIGYFAKVVRCNGDEIWLQGTRELPKDIAKRSLILDSIDRKSSVHLKFNRTQDDQYWVFKIATAPSKTA